MTRVLVVDDSEGIAALLSFRLRGAGYEVTVAEDGKSALETAASDPPDLIMLDVMMPVMDGYQVLSKLKDSPSLGDIPVIVLSSRAGEEDVVKALELGADDYITKPYRPQEMMARIKTVLSRYGRSHHGSGATQSGGN